jgi:hypothetical protein
VGEQNKASNKHLCQTNEIESFKKLKAYHDVVGFDVSVDNPVGVQVLQGHAHLEHEVLGDVLRQALHRA